MKADEVMKILNKQLLIQPIKSTLPFYYQSPPSLPQISNICNKILSFPLSTFNVKHYVQNNVAIIGDTAHSIHPMAGQGFNSGVYDVILLTNNIMKNINAGNNIGEIQNLIEYEQKSKLINTSSQLGIEFIKQSYALENDFLQYSRNMAINFINTFPEIKNQLTNVANQHPFSQNFNKY